jgi:hypothetical protein
MSLKHMPSKLCKQMCGIVVQGGWAHSNALQRMPSMYKSSIVWVCVGWYWNAPNGVRPGWLMCNEPELSNIPYCAILLIDIPAGTHATLLCDAPIVVLCR